MASKFDESLKKILNGDVNSLVDNIPDEDIPSAQTTEELVPVVYEQKETNLTLANHDIQEDYEFARSNLYGLIGRSNAALDLALKIAVMSEMPRALEVAATLIKTSADISKELISVHKAIESGSNKAKEPPGKYTQVNNYYGDRASTEKILDNLPDTDDEE